MLGLLAELYVRNPEQAPILWLGACALGVVGCLFWLLHLYRTLVIQKCCGKVWQECKCRKIGPDKPCVNCGQTLSQHDPECPHYNPTLFS